MMKTKSIILSMAVLPIILIGCLGGNSSVVEGNQGVSSSIPISNAFSSSSVITTISSYKPSSSSVISIPQSSNPVSSVTPSSSSVIVQSSSSSVVSGLSYGTLTDARDGKTYKTVKIGTQTWMAENLNYTPTSGNSWCYSNSSANCTTYGRLYDWSTAMGGATSSNASPSGVQGVCPNGWHLPSDAEWTTLNNYVDANNGSDGIGKSLKAISSLWNTSSGISNTDQFGFSALPAGLYYGGSFYDLGNNADCWSSTESNASGAWYRLLGNDNDYFSRKDYDSKTVGFSVRCAQN